MKKVGDKLIPKTEDEFDAEDIKKVEIYAKAINMLYCAVNPDDYRKISCCSTAKEMWDKLEVTYEGTDQVRGAKIDFLTQEYEMFRMKPGEKIDDMFNRFSKIINDLHALKKTYANKDLVRKILRSLTPEWRSKADAIYESIGVSNVTIDGLRGLPIRGDDIATYGGDDWILNNEAVVIRELGITNLIRHSGAPTIHSAPPDKRLLLYIITRILRPRDSSHTSHFNEDLKAIHAIIHGASINWAKFSIERMDWTLQRQHHDMTAFFRGVNYVPPPFDSTFLGQNYEGEDEEDNSYAPSSSPDEADFEDAVDGDPMDVEDDVDDDEDADA
ncbi:unnamed protein product [Cuscuta campestris]|uniref:Uncharacterized protein n=1 Tax=Cuscuta campestris TaxID=132261 RepID=A0A484L3I3_9ASTE|nr:unnamed protein product [Cuscuta campestris]